MNVTPQIVLVAGPPGAGKTAVAEALATAFERSVLLRGDTFFAAVTSGAQLPWVPEADRQNETVIGAIGAAAHEFADGGYVVVVDAVIGPWFLDTFMERVSRTVSYVILRPTVRTTLKRATGRAAPELVDPEVVRHMHDAFADVGTFERFVIDPTSMSVEETVAAVMRRIAEADNLLR